MASSPSAERSRDARSDLPKCYKCGRHLYEGRTCRGCGTPVSALDRNRTYRRLRRVAARLSMSIGKFNATRIITFVIVLALLLITIYFFIQIGNSTQIAPTKKRADALLDLVPFAATFVRAMLSF